MTIIQHTVPAGAGGERLDRYLTGVLPKKSRAQIQRLIEGGNVEAHGKPVKASHRVTPGEELSITIKPEAPLLLKSEPIPLHILYEDQWLLVVEKPPGLVVHPAPGHPSGTLVNALLSRAAPLSSRAGDLKPGIVHRLDQDTSGVMVVAKDDFTHADLSSQFAKSKVHRVYLALVHGVVQQDEGTMDAPIGRHPLKRQQMAVRLGAGRAAVTRYRVLERFKGATYLELTPQTGRTHQLRVHLKHMGHPILGDARYGIPAGLSRQALHANRLGFQHPALKRWMEFASPWPPDLSQTLSSLRK